MNNVKNIQAIVKGNVNMVGYRKVVEGYGLSRGLAGYVFNISTDTVGLLADLKENTSILTEHTGLLKENTSILTEHTGLLKENTSILTEHTESLNKHTELLQGINDNFNTLPERIAEAIVKR